MSQPTSIKIDEVEYVRKDSVQPVEAKPGESLYQLGSVVFVRTVTYHYLGVITFLSETEMVLSAASWVADSGRFGEALKNGKLNEVEPYVDPVSVSRGSIVDLTIWRHELPREAK